MFQENKFDVMFLQIIKTCCNVYKQSLIMGKMVLYYVCGHLFKLAERLNYRTSVLLVEIIIKRMHECMNCKLMAYHCEPEIFEAKKAPFLESAYFRYNDIGFD